MRRRNVVVATVVILVVVIAIAAFLGRNSSILKEIDASEIEEITFHDTYEDITIAEQGDVQIVFEKLQAMKFKKILTYHKFGSALLMDVKLKSGEKLSMSILSNDIIINGENYTPDKDYTDYIRNIFIP